MSLRPSVARILAEHVTLELECIDRMYLNLYVPGLQYEQGVVAFFRAHRGATYASSALMHPMTRAFVARIESFAADHDIPVITFRKGQRKDDVAHEYLARHDGTDAVLFIGKAQEKTQVFRTEKRRNPQTGAPYPWIVRSTAMVNHYYLYGFDRDFGPFFIKFCSYFPYTAKGCLNGHEWLKRQLDRAGIAYDALDNGLASVTDPTRAQAIADSLSATKIEVFIRRWLRALPSPFTAADRRAGYRYDISILQAEFSLTQVLDRPVVGRIFFEEVIRDNLDIGRPDQVSLIFDRRITRRTPGRFRTRVITRGVVASLHVDYKHCRIKVYFKEGRALRTECTINDTRDFAIGRRLCNLPALREVGFQANRRLLGVLRAGSDPAEGEDAFARVCTPAIVQGQRAPALRFADPRVQALLAAILVFRLLPRGFSNRDLREHLAPLLGLDPTSMTQGRMTYDLRRLRLHGLIERIPGSHRYHVTPFGLRVGLLFSRTYSRVLRPALAHTFGAQCVDTRLRTQFARLEATIDDLITRAGLAA